MCKSQVNKSEIEPPNSLTLSISVINCLALLWANSSRRLWMVLRYRVIEVRGSIVITVSNFLKSVSTVYVVSTMYENNIIQLSRIKGTYVSWETNKLLSNTLWAGNVKQKRWIKHAVAKLPNLIVRV